MGADAPRCESVVRGLRQGTGISIVISWAPSRIIYVAIPSVGCRGDLT